MKIYEVINSETGYQERFYKLNEAKKAMKEHHARGFITKIWGNGDFEPCGEIQLKGNNKTFVANTCQKKESYC